MNSSTTRLDDFEAALLIELRSVVSQRASALPPATARHRGAAAAGRFRPIRPRWYILAALAVAAAVLATVAVNELRPTPAFAVSGGNNTAVKVHVMRLEGAAALEKALKKRGINSDISYLPPHSVCAGTRYAQKDTPGLMLSVSADDFTVQIPPGSVGRHDVFVLAASVAPVDNGMYANVDFGITSGPVKPCRVVPES